MTAKLLSETESHPELTLIFDEGDNWTIGRDESLCQLVIDDASVEAAQATATRTAEGFTIESIDSEHPIEINGTPIQEAVLLHEGDKVKIGDITFRFSEEEKTLFTEEAPDVAEVHFGLEEEGRWLLKVVGGPNNGAEFFMKTGHDYLIGTDPQVCDVILQDTSVSRRHAQIHISDDDILSIEDLKSRNGVFIKGNRVEGKQTLSPSTLVTVGTSSFIVYDREGDMQTIISPLLPSIVKALQQEQKAGTEGEAAGTDTEGREPSSLEAPKKLGWESLVLYAALIAIVLMIGYGTYSLFQTAPLERNSHENVQEQIGNILKAYPAVQFSYDPNKNALTVTGHLLTPSDKTDLMYDLQQVRQIESLDHSGLIIDEGVWREINSVLSSNPAWKEITIKSPTAGSFVVTGLLKTRKQAEALDAYLRVNFPFFDLLEKQIVVEEDVINQVMGLLSAKNLKGIVIKFVDGDLIFSGTISHDSLGKLNEVMEESRKIPGVRSSRSNVATTAPAEVGIVNLSDRYEVTGQSQLGHDRYSVVIEGRILQEGDVLDGMTITSISKNTVFLRKGETQYRINYK